VSRKQPWAGAGYGLKRLIRREVRAREQIKTGTVLSVRRLVDVDGTGSASWVVDVDIGTGEPLRDVSVKAGSDGARFYAGLGMSVQLARNTSGRFDIIGPGDRVMQPTVVKRYSLGADTPVSTSNVGLTIERVAYEFYKGPNPPVEDSLWNDGVTPFPLVRILDGEENPV
jgi:hypothetical protein